jgi:hypothetical protein
MWKSDFEYGLRGAGGIYKKPKKDLNRERMQGRKGERGKYKFGPNGLCHRL